MSLRRYVPGSAPICWRTVYRRNAAMGRSGHSTVGCARADSWTVTTRRFRQCRHIGHLLLPVVAVLTLSVGVGSSSGVDAAQVPAVVTRVIDGDTLEVRLDGRQETVRLIGVDTPETVHPRIGVELWGPEASAFTKGLLPPATRVRLELDVQERDQYGRLLAYVYLPDGRMLNALLLEAGLAQLLTVPPNVRHVDLFVRLQREAREAGRGMWSEQPLAGVGVRIERVDLRAEQVVLVNDGAEVVDLSGWRLISVVGNQTYRFPPGTKLKPGERLVVKSGPKAAAGPGVLIWTRQPVWNNEGDPAELRDASGMLIDRDRP